MRGACWHTPCCFIGGLNPILNNLGRPAYCIRSVAGITLVEVMLASVTSSYLRVAIPTNFNSAGVFHYDQSLGAQGSNYQILSWKEYRNNNGTWVQN